jgi:hypothetical protein
MGLKNESFIDIRGGTGSNTHVPKRVSDTPGGDPRMQHRVTGIARYTYGEAFKGLMLGSVLGVVSLTTLSRFGPSKFRKYYTANNMSFALFGGAAMGAFLKSAVGIRNAVELDIASSPLSTAYERSQYQRAMVNEHNAKVNSFEERYEHRRVAIEKTKQEKSHKPPSY